MLAFVIVAVFIAGLMVGRTPEYLGKKIQAYEMKMASLVVPLRMLRDAALKVAHTDLEEEITRVRAGDAEPTPHPLPVYTTEEIGQVAHAVVTIDFNYEEGSHGPEHPVVRNIEIRDVTCKKAERALDIRGFPDAKIRNVRLERCTVESAAKANVVENVEGLALADVMVNGKRVDA